MRGWRWIAAGSLAVAVDGAPASATGAYADMAAELTAGRERAAPLSVAVLPFTDEDGGPSGTGARIARGLVVELVRGRRAQVVERELLPQVMAEHSLGAAGLLDQSRLRALGSLSPADAILAGSYAATPRGISVHARLIDVESGIVLAASERTLAPDPQEASVALADAIAFAVPVPAFTVPVPVLEPTEAGLLRDAPSDRPDCAGAVTKIDDLQALILDLKARYWAQQRREARGAPREAGDPGSLITDRRLKSRFYERLEYYSSARKPPRLSPEEVRIFVAADRQAFHLRRDCGL